MSGVGRILWTTAKHAEAPVANRCAIRRLQAAERTSIFTLRPARVAKVISVSSENLLILPCVSLIRERGEYLGDVAAPDKEAAEVAAVEGFEPPANRHSRCPCDCGDSAGVRDRARMTARNRT